MQPAIRTFFDEATFTATHVVWDPGTRRAAIIDSVKDYDPKSGRIATASADAVVAFVAAETLAVEWILETHVHADHLTAAPYLKARLGGRTAIGARIDAVQGVFKKIFNRSEEHTSELQSLMRISYAVFCWKKKIHNRVIPTSI